MYEPHTQWPLHPPPHANVSTCQFPNRCITQAESASCLAFLALESELQRLAAPVHSATNAGSLPLKVAATALFTQVETMFCCSDLSIHLKTWETWGQWLLAYDICFLLIVNNRFEQTISNMPCKRLHGQYV